MAHVESTRHNQETKLSTTQKRSIAPMIEDRGSETAVKLHPEDMGRFVESIDNPTPPNAAFSKSLELYNKLVVEDKLHED